jgi:hypothetical protein
MQISDLLYRSALSLLIKLIEFLKSKIPILKSEIFEGIKLGSLFKSSHTKESMMFMESSCSFAPEINQAPLHGFNAGKFKAGNGFTIGFGIVKEV